MNKIRLLLLVMAFISFIAHAEERTGNEKTRISSTPCLTQTFEFTAGLQGDHFKYRLSCPELGPIGNATLEVHKAQNNETLCKLANFGRSEAKIDQSHKNDGFVDLFGWYDGCTATTVTIKIYPIQRD